MEAREDLGTELPQGLLIQDQGPLSTQHSPKLGVCKSEFLFPTGVNQSSQWAGESSSLFLLLLFFLSTSLLSHTGAILLIHCHKQLAQPNHAFPLSCLFAAICGYRF